MQQRERDDAGSVAICKTSMLFMKRCCLGVVHITGARSSPHVRTLDVCHGARTYCGRSVPLRRNPHSATLLSFAAAARPVQHTPLRLTHRLLRWRSHVGKHVKSEMCPLKISRVTICAFCNHSVVRPHMRLTSASWFLFSADPSVRLSTPEAASRADLA